MLAWCLLVWAAIAVPDRSEPPAVTPPVPLPLPDPEVHVLGPGATAWHVRVPSVRKVAMHVVLDGGMVELQGAPTEAARAMGWMLDVAAGRRSAAELARFSDLHEIEVVSQIGLHELTLSVTAPRTELDEALGVLKDVIEAPRFPRRGLRRYLEDTQTFHEVEAPASPQWVARLGTAHAWFPADHPYGARRRLDMLDTVSRGDVRQLWDRIVSRTPLTVVVVGDVGWEEVSDSLTATLGGLGAAVTGAEGLPVPVPASSVVGVHMPGQEQVVVRLRTAAPSGQHPDHVAMWGTQWALGGHILSRLNRVLREEKDYTYGARARYQFGRTWGTFTVAVDVASENLADTITVIEDQIAGMEAEGLTAEEITGAHRSALLDWNTTLQSAEVASGHYLEALEHGWRGTQMLDRMSRLALLTPEDGSRVAGAWLTKEQPRIWLVVGDRSRIEPQLELLGETAEWITPDQSVLGDF